MEEIFELRNALLCGDLDVEILGATVDRAATIQDALGLLGSCGD